MKIVRHENIAGIVYRVYPFLKPDSNLPHTLPQYINVIVDYGNLAITSNFTYVDGTIWGAMQMANAWQMVYKIALALEADYEADIAVDEVIVTER